MQSRAGRLAAGALLGLVLVFPSLDLVAKYAGRTGAAAYALVVIAVSLVACSRRKMTPSAGSFLIPLLVTTFALTFAVVYPVVNTRGDRGGPEAAVPSGSDRDDALNVGVDALLDGRNPYAARTYLNNPISPLPGSLLLAAPFGWLGNAAIQNIVWFAVWLALLGRLAHGRFAVTVALVTLFASPVVLHDLLTGGDLAVNAIVVLLAIVVAAVARPGMPLVLAASLAGVAFATRLPFALLLPRVGAFIHRRLGPRWMVTYLAVVAMVAVAITLPFYLANPGDFAPWQTQNKFRFLADGLPSAATWLPLLCAALSCLAPVAVWRSGWPLWLVAGGLVVLAPVAIYSALAAAFGATATATTGYALPAVFLAVPGLLAARHPTTRWPKDLQ
jgi:hypothetical protein